MTAYYNENDPFAAAWLRNLIAAGLIAPGEVDDRSIEDVTAADLAGYVQCHFFAGIGGWSYALRLAGWPDDRPAWTGSCPCQPFSMAGKGAGVADERHLWPVWFRLIDKCQPPVVFGEQVAGKAALSWLDIVYDDLEAAGYAVGAANLCAAGVGAPHIRQRLWFVGCRRGSTMRLAHLPEYRRRQGNADKRGCVPGGDTPVEWLRSADHSTDSSMADPDLSLKAGFVQLGGETAEESREMVNRSRCSRVYNPWTNSTWLSCRDGKSRPVESGTFPLANGIPGRVGRLRAYGNAIVPQLAAEVIKAFMEIEQTLAL